MERQKKYALRKVAGYGLVSCAVGLMFVGVTQISADEVTGPGVTGQPLEQPKTNPAISSRAKEAFATAIAKFSKNPVLTGNDIQTGEGISDALSDANKEGMSNVRTAFDQLPEIFRRVPKSVQFYAKADGKYGVTDSLGGNVSLNAAYYGNNDFSAYDQQFEGLYHELSHVIDGATYTNNDGAEYSLSRDEQVAPLLERVDRNAPVYETWATAFARYTMSRMFNKVERDSRYQPLMLYFDELLGETLFGSRGYTPSGGMIPSHQSGVQVTMTDTGLKIAIDNDKVFLPSERIVITLTGAAHNILPNGPLTINGVEVGHAGLMYIGKNEAIRQRDKWIERVNASPLDTLRESDFDELMGILTQPFVDEGVYEIRVNADKLNTLKDRTIRIKISEDTVLHPDIEKRYLLGTGHTTTGLQKRINHSLIKKWVAAHSQDWKFDPYVTNFGGYLDRLQYIPNVGDHGEILYNQASVYRYPMALNMDLNELLDDAKPRENTFETFSNYDYDNSRGRVSISESPSYENYKEQLEGSVFISHPSRIHIMNGDWGTSKPRVFAPGDIRYEYFLNTEDSGLSVKPELIGTTQHVSKDYVNDFDKAETFTWSPDRSFAQITAGEKIKGITTHYEWDVIYEKDKITVVNTNEVHVPKYARVGGIGPELEIGKEVVFRPEVVFEKLDQWEYDKNINWGQGGWKIPNVSAYHHSYYHDSLNNETKDITSKPEAYELLKRKKDIIVEGEKVPHQVTVQFVDTLGNKIALDKVLKENAYADEIYTYEPETIEGYQYTKLADDSAPLKGFVGSKDKVIKLVYKDVRQPVVTKENTTAHWTIHFQDEEGQPIREDAKIHRSYEREITTNPDGTKTIGEWTFVNQTTENADDLQATEPTFGEKTSKTKFSSQVVIPGRHGEKYLAKINNQWKDWRGLNFAVDLDDYISLQEGEQKADVYGEYTVGYQAKDANINVRLVDADNPDKVYKSVDVPAFTNYEHNGLDTHVFDSFKSEGELLDTIPSEVSLDGENKQITIRLERQTMHHTVRVKNERGDVLKEVTVEGKKGDAVKVNYDDTTELDKRYVLTDLPKTIDVQTDGLTEVVVPDKLYTVNWKVYNDDKSNILHQGTVTGKYGEKLSDKLDLSQYHLDEASTNRLNDYRFGVDSVTGGTSPQTVDYSFYSRKDVTGEVTFKDVFGSEIHQAITYQGKSQDKLSDETIEQMRQALLENKETHPNVRITINNGSMPEHVYTDVDTFLNDLPNLRLGDEASNIQVQYGVTVTKTYPFKVQSSFTRLLVPESLEAFAERHHYDGYSIVDNDYSPTDGKLYDVFLPCLLSDDEVESYEATGKVRTFLESMTGTANGERGSVEDWYRGFDDVGLDTSSVKFNPIITTTYPLTLTMQIDPSGNVSVSNVEVGEAESDEPVSVRFLPGFDTYYIGYADGVRAFLDSVYKHEVDVDSLKFDDTFNYQVGAQLSPEDITKLMNAFGDMGKLDNNTEASLDEKINNVFRVSKHNIGLTPDANIDVTSWTVTRVTGEEAKEWLDGKHYLRTAPILLVTPKTYQNKVKIVNDDGEILAEKDLSAKYKDTVNYDMTDAFKALEDKYITSDDLSGNWTAATENQDIIIHAKERFIKNTETKQIKRIVRFHDGQKVVGEEDQVVTFTRTVKKEVLTGELTYSDWTSDHPQFDEITVPTKEDKTANVQSVPEKAVTAEDKDEIVDVYYSPKMVDSDTQTKATIHVTYKYQDGTIYKEFDVQADKGSILDGSDLEMLPDNMNFTDDFTTYEVKGDGTDTIERTVKKQTSDSETQTKATIHVVYKNVDGTIYKEFDVQADKGSILDGSDLEMLPDNMDFTDDFTTYEVKGDGTDHIERTVKKQTSDSETQTKATIHVVYKNVDGTIYKEFDVQADKGSILDGSDLEMLPDNMDFTDDFTTYEVKGDGTDHIERTVKKQTSDSETQTKATIHVVYKNADGTIYKEFDVQADKGSILDGSDLEMLPDNMDFTDDFTTYEVKGDGTDHIERTVKKQTSDSETQTKATIHVVYKNADGTIYKEFDVQADKGAILDGSDLEMLPDDMNFTDDFTTYEVKGDGTDHIERTVKKQTSDSETQTKATIHVVYKNADGTIYKEFDVQADKGTILDGSDLEMLPDNMDFTDDFTTYEVKGDGTDHIERTVKKQTSDSETQTKATIHVVYKNADGTIYKEFDVQADKGAILDGSDLEMLPDDMNFTDDFTTYEVKGDGTDHIERTVKKQTSDNGTQTDKPDTSDSETQTKARIHVVYRNQDGTVYKEFDVEADKGTILDGSDLEMLPDDMDFTDEFTTYEVKGDGTDVIERTVKKNTSDNGTQTDKPDTSDNGTQTDKPDTSDNGTQTDKPDTSDNGTQTKATIHVVYKNVDGTIYKEFDVQADKGTILDGSDLEMLPDDMDFTDDFMFYEVKGDGTDHIERTVKKQTSDSETQTDKPDTSDNGTQTEVPNTSDNGTQTEVPNTSDNGTQTEVPNTSENGTQTDKPNTSDNGTQTDTPDTSDNGTQTDTSDNGTQTDTSDNGTQTDKPNTSDNGTQTDTSDNGTQTDKPNTSDNGTQTDKPNTSDNGTQTDTSENGTQTTKPNTSDNGTQTTKPDGKDNGTQTEVPKPKVVRALKSDKSTTKAELPKTGTQATFTHMMGLAFIGLTSLFGFRKHKEE